MAPGACIQPANAGLPGCQEGSSHRRPQAPLPQPQLPWSSCLRGAPDATGKRPGESSLWGRRRVVKGLPWLSSLLPLPARKILGDKHPTLHLGCRRHTETRPSPPALYGAVPSYGSWMLTGHPELEFLCARVHTRLAPGLPSSSPLGLFLPLHGRLLPLPSEAKTNSTISLGSTRAKWLPEQPRIRALRKGVRGRRPRLLPLPQEA